MQDLQTQSLPGVASYSCPANTILVWSIFAICAQLFWLLLMKTSRHCIQQQVKKLTYPIAAKSIIQRAYINAKGSATRIFTPDGWMTLISSSEQIKEITDAKCDELSFHAAAKQMLKPQYTMNKFNWYDQRGLEGTGYVRTVRTLLRNQLPRLTPGVRGIIERVLSDQVGSERSLNGSQLCRKLLTYTCGYIYFGTDTDQKFIEAAHRYNEDVVYGAEILKMTPKYLVPLIGPIIPLVFHRQSTFHEELVKIIDARLKSNIRAGEHNDVIQFVIDTSPKTNRWDATRIAHEVMILWFGVGQGLTISLTFALYNLCDHLEYIKPLREEVEGLSGTEFLVSGQGLPLMDSFLKESSRWTPVEFITTRRYALKAFTFLDGTHVSQGESLCIPIGPMFRDATFFPDPDVFDGFRYVDPKLVGKSESIQPDGPSCFTDINQNWTIWGTGKISCPGRFFVAYIMKHVLFYILENYDVEMKGNNRKHTFSWRTFTMPKPREMVYFRRRE